MIIEFHFEPRLSHASYLVGCESTGEAVVIDPSRHLDDYVKQAEANDLKITAGVETHMHADFVSGMRELAEQLEAHLFVSDAGDSDWKYLYISDYRHTLLKEGDSFEVGKIQFQVLSTPGHSPESISLILTDGDVADKPMGIFTGDFLFVGDVGRPDLFEEVLGVTGSKEHHGSELFEAIQKLNGLPDYLQIWPAHRAGSLCGMAPGALPVSTLGYERMFNWAFQQKDRREFLRYILSSQPVPPTYFAEVKKINRDGPPVLSKIPYPVRISTEDLPGINRSDALILDTRGRDAYAKSHIPGALGVPLNKSFITYASWVVPYEKDIYLIVEESHLDTVVRDLRSIGLDAIKGHLTPSEVENADIEFTAFSQVTPSQISQEVAAGRVQVIDVRAKDEFDAGHLPGAMHLPLTSLQQNLSRIPQCDSPLLLTCRSGLRSFVAATILEGQGYKDVMNLEGGFLAWSKACIPYETAAE
jgi:hydroxyacylglutathione hydrolase